MSRNSSSAIRRLSRRPPRRRCAAPAEALADSSGRDCVSGGTQPFLHAPGSAWRVYVTAARRAERPVCRPISRRDSSHTVFTDEPAPALLNYIYRQSASFALDLGRSFYRGCAMPLCRRGHRFKPGGQSTAPCPRGGERRSAESHPPRLAAFDR